MPPVATPAIKSGRPKFSSIVFTISCRMNVLIRGYDKVLRLSQYIGDFHPDAQVYGSSTLNVTAFICNRNSATLCAELKL